MKIIFHVGMHKTGSSSIQHNLVNYEDHKYFYSNIEGNLDGNSSLAIRVLSDCIEDINKSITKQKIKKRFIKDLKYAKSSGKDLIISGEGMFRIPEKNLHKLLHFFNDYADEYIFIAYVREPLGWMKSAFLQWAKTSMPSSNIIQFPVYRDLEKFFDAPIKKQVIVREFSRDLLYKNDAVSDFFHLLGLNQPKKLKTANVSPKNLEIVKILYWLFGLFENNQTRGALISFKKFLQASHLPSTDFERDFFSSFYTYIQDDVFWLKSKTDMSFKNSNESRNIFKSGTLIKIDNYSRHFEIDRAVFNEIMRLDNNTRNILTGFLFGATSVKYEFVSDRELAINVFLQFMPERKKINTYFTAGQYLKLNKDIKKMNPLSHFLQHGIKEQRLY
tara:strand:- start:6847 stop:8010 length:1164 start_codon:yes stop_codon:yes gene_type:complete